MYFSSGANHARLLGMNYVTSHLEGGSLHLTRTPSRCGPEALAKHLQHRRRKWPEIPLLLVGTAGRWTVHTTWGSLCNLNCRRRQRAGPAADLRLQAPPASQLVQTSETGIPPIRSIEPWIQHAITPQISQPKAILAFDKPLSFVARTCIGFPESRNALGLILIGLRPHQTPTLRAPSPPPPRHHRALTSGGVGAAPGTSPAPTAPRAPRRW